MRSAWGLIGLMLAAGPAAFALDWGGTISAVGADSRADSTHSQTLDQQYQIYFSERPYPVLNYSAALRYRHFRTNGTGSQAYWQTEMQPSLLATWTTQVFKVDGNGMYRDNSDQQRAHDLSSRSFGVFGRTTLPDAPRLSAAYQWDRNINDLELLGLDTRQSRLSAGVDYDYKSVSLRYGLTDLHTVNSSSGLEQFSTRHTVQYDQSVLLFSRALVIQPSYQYNYRIERETEPSTGETLLPLQPVAGLYSVNPAPQFGTLDPFPQLIDGDLATPASTRMNLSGDGYQNFGLDFGSALNLDHIFICTDTLANPVQRWAVYSSTDNLNWTLVRDYSPYPFDQIFRRFEIAFPSQTVRYLKVVDEPALREYPVYVTEVRALVTRAKAGANRPTNQLASLGLRLNPVKWLAAQVGGSLTRNSRSQTSNAQELDDFQSSLTVLASSALHLSGRYQMGSVNFPDQATARTTTEMISGAVESQWMRTLNSRLDISRQREFADQQLDRRLDAVTMLISETFFPALKGITQLSQSEDRRFSAADLYRIRSISQRIESQPSTRSTLAVDYRKDFLSSRAPGIPATRQALSARGTWNLTETVFAGADGSMLVETSNTFYSWNGNLSWLPTPKLSLSSGYSETRADNSTGDNLYSASASFRPTLVTEIVFSYARSGLVENSLPQNTTLTLSFRSRF
jgi:hypothetical protein